MSSPSQQIDFAELDPQSLPVQFLEYWKRISPQGRLPGRQHLDPVDIPQILPWLALVDVQRKGETLDYLVRLVGTANVRLVGLDPTGMRLRDSFEQSIVEPIIEVYDRTVTAAEPGCWIVSVPSRQKEFILCYRALFPLARDGQTVDMLAALLVPIKGDLRP